jgi:hypothetical protein
MFNGLHSYVTTTVSEVGGRFRYHPYRILYRVENDRCERRRIGPALCGLNLLERRLVEVSYDRHLPFDDRVIFVSSVNCAEFSSRLSEVAQTLDAISGIQFLVGGRGLGEAWLLGTVRVRRCAGV